MSMKETLEFYQQQLSAAKSSLPSWVMPLHAKASERFNRWGLPTRQQEAWRYTQLDQFMKHRFAHSLTETTNDQRVQLSPVEASFPAVPHFRRHHGLSGVTVEESTEDLTSVHTPLPAGLLFMPLDQALVEHQTKVQPYLDQIIQHQHGFHALNSALLNTGTFIYVPAGMKVSLPLVLSHGGEAGKMLSARHLVILEAGSEAVLIEDYYAQLENESALTNTITEIVLAPDANLTHYKIQRENKESYHVGHVTVRQAKSSTFQSHLLSLGGKLARSEYHLQLVEPEASCSLNGVYLPSKGQHMDQQSLICHEVPHCQSEQDYKGILMGGSRAVFNGKIRVAKGAQQTQAKQQNKNLLLALNAEIDTQPQLEIFADDVVCTHGATVGQLDEDALFYLAARGIDETEARRYLIQGFIENNLRLVRHSQLAEWLGTLIHQRLSEAL